MIANQADDGCLPHHMREIFGGLASTDIEYHLVQGATHYYFDQPDKLAEGLPIGCSWLQRKGFIEH